MSLDYNGLVQFMKVFKIDYLNRFGELIIDEKTNTYTNIENCEGIDDVELHVVYSLCRPIYKGLDNKHATRLLKRVNDYFEVNLTKEDMGLMYQELCYTTKLEEFKDFIKRGFPMEELKNIPA